MVRMNTLSRLERAVEVLEEKYKKIEEGLNPRKLKLDNAISEYRRAYQGYSREVGANNWHKLVPFSARAEPIITYAGEVLKD